MENSEENPHLNIETVTPETEKDGQPNDQKFNHRVENEAAKESDEKPEADEPEGTGEKDPYAMYEKDDAGNSQDEEPKEDEPNDEKSNGEKSNDEEPDQKDNSDSDIETVAP
jgi:hypothetical protein